jgi:hypothetical protein
MSCRFLSTLSCLLIFLDVSLDMIGDVDRDDAWDVVCDDVGVVVLDVVVLLIFAGQVFIVLDPGCVVSC